MSVVDTAALRATAEAATPGPWWRDGFTVRGGPEGRGVAPASNANVEVAAHIAAFDPPTCLGLLDELDRLTADLADRTGSLEMALGSARLRRERLLAAEQVIANVRALADECGSVTGDALRALLP